MKSSKINKKCKLLLAFHSWLWGVFMAKKHNRIVSKRFWLTATAIISLMHPAFASASEHAAQAQGGWQVGAVHNVNNGTPTYCAMANSYNDKSVLAFARDNTQQGSIALELNTSSFTVGEEYSVSIDVDGKLHRKLAAKAESKKSIIVQIGQDAELIKSMQSEGTLQLTLGGKQYAFMLSGFDKAFGGLVECTSQLSDVETAAVKIKRPDTSNAALLEKQLEEVQTLVSELRSEKKTLEAKIKLAQKEDTTVALSSQISGFEAELKEMHLRNADLTKVLSEKQHNIKELKLEIDRDDTDKMAIKTRITELEELLKVQNKVIEEQKASLNGQGQGAQDLQSNLDGQKEKMTELRRMNLSLQQELDMKNDEIVEIKTQIKTLKSNEAEDYDGQVARLKNEVDLLQAKIVEIENVKNNLDAQIVEKLLLVEDGQQLVSELKAEKADLVLKLQSRADVAVNNTSGRKDLEKLIKDQSANLQKLRQENLIMQQRLETSNLADLEVAALREEKNELEKKLEEHQGKQPLDAQAPVVDVAKNSAKLKKLEDENLKLNQQIGNSVEQGKVIASLKAEREQLKVLLTQKENSKTENLSKLQKLEKQVQDKTAALQSLRQENLVISQQLEEGQQKLLATTAKYETKTHAQSADLKRLKDLDAHIKENVALKADIIALKQSVDVLKREKSELDLQIANYISMKGTKNEAVTKLEKVVSERSAQLAAIRAENITLQRELLGKEQRLAKLSGISTNGASPNELASYKTDLANAKNEVRDLLQEKMAFEAHIAELELSINDIDGRKQKLVQSGAQDQKMASQLADAQLLIDQQTNTIQQFKEKLDQQTRLTALNKTMAQHELPAQNVDVAELEKLRLELGETRSAAVASAEYLEYTRRELDKAHYKIRSLETKKQGIFKTAAPAKKTVAQPFGMTPRELVEPPKAMQMVSKTPTPVATENEIVVQMEALDQLVGSYPQKHTSNLVPQNKSFQSAVVVNTGAIDQNFADYSYAMGDGFVGELHKPQVIVDDAAMVSMVDGTEKQQMMLQAENIAIKLIPPQSANSLAEAKKYSMASDNTIQTTFSSLDGHSALNQPIHTKSVGAKIERDNVKENSQNRTERFLDSILDKHSGAKTRHKSNTKKLQHKTSKVKKKIDSTITAVNKIDAVNVRRLLHDANVPVTSFAIDKYKSDTGQVTAYQQWKNNQFTGIHESQNWQQGYHIKQYIDGVVGRYQNDCKSEVAVKPVHYESNDGYEIAIADILCPSQENAYLVSGIFYGKQGKKIDVILHSGHPDTEQQLGLVRDNLFKEVKSQIKEIIG